MVNPLIDALMMLWTPRIWLSSADDVIMLMKQRTLLDQFQLSVSSKQNKASTGLPKITSS